MKVFCKEELKNIAIFEKNHINCYRKPDSKTPRISFSINQNWGTGIGVTTEITCNCCGKTEDVTDYNSW